MCEPSLIEVPARLIKAKAEAYLAARRTRIFLKREKLIAELMTRRRNWLARILLPKMTRERAIRIIKDSGEWDLIWFEGGKWAQKAEQILHLAEGSVDGRVLLSASDSWILKQDV